MRVHLFLLLAISLAALLPATVSFAQTVSFSTPLSFAVGNFPQSVAIGDLNGDGRPDLVVANEFSATISILLGDATRPGGFAPAINLAVTSPSSVAIGDLNGDGRPDLVAVSSVTPGTVSIFLNDPSITPFGFGAPVVFPVGDEPIKVAIGDLNGDGKLDLVVTNFRSNSVSILLGTGSGGFLPPANFPVGTGPESVAIGDLNGDGRPDLAVAYPFSNTVSIWRGNGDGTFAAPTTLAVGIEPRGIAIGDFTGDNKPDLVVANIGSNTVSLLVGTGDGTTFSLPINFPAGVRPASVAIGDFNGDNIPDVVVANTDILGGTVSVLLGTGLPGARAFSAPLSFAVTTNPRFAAIGDLNGDGKPDLAVVNQTSNTVSILLNTTAVCIEGCFSPDSDGDGIPDNIDNCRNTPNRNQADRDGDGVGDACDNCPLLANANQYVSPTNSTGLGDACQVHYAETLAVPADTKAPGEPLWVTATFKNTSGFEITTIKPDCVNTTFTVTRNANPSVPLAPIMREKIYGIPNDLVNIGIGAEFSVTCNLTEMFDSSILTDPTPGDAAAEAYTVVATYANYIVDRELGGGVCGPLPVYPCVFNVWIGAVNSAPATVSIKGAPIEKKTAQASFSPAEWALSGEPTIWVTIDFANTGHGASEIDLSTIRLNGSVSILAGSASIAGNILTVRFNGVAAIRSLGTPVNGSTLAATVDGSNTAKSFFFSAQGTVVLVNAIGVAIDIKPGAFPNSINLGSNGVVPVAILSTANFDAKDVDIASITLAGASVRLKGNATPMASFQDVNGDGRLDLVVQINTEALELNSTDTLAVLHAKTKSGSPIIGLDSIRVVP